MRVLYLYYMSTISNRLLDFSIVRLLDYSLVGLKGSIGVRERVERHPFSIAMFYNLKRSYFGQC